MSGAGYVSGKEVMCLELARGLARRGFVPLVLTSCWNDGEFLRRLRCEDLPFRVLPIGFVSATLTRALVRMTAEQLWRWPGLLWRYARLLRDERPGWVVHTNWQHLLLLFGFLRPNRDLCWLHELVPNKPQYRRLFLSLERRLSGFVCVSHAAARSLRALGIQESSIEVIHNGIDDPSNGIGNAPRKESVSQRPVRIGIVGQVGDWKGHGDLFEAMGHLRQSGANCELDVFGTGDSAYLDSLRQTATDLGVANLVRWRGFVADRAKIYTEMDICVVPSRFEEPFGLTALEAAFFELPVVASRRGGLEEVVEHERTGLLVEAGQPLQLANALERLCQDAGLRRAIGSEARRRAVERFDSDRFLERFVTRLSRFSQEA